jgi:hypothetical protein
MLGSPTNPLSPDQHNAKARRCLTFGGLGEVDVGLAQAISTLEDASDAAKALDLEAPTMRTPRLD